MRNTSNYPKGWPKISLAVKKAARNRCEWCRRKKNVNLVTAHLDQEKSNCTNENLACLCGQCHHRYDMYGASPFLPKPEIASRINQMSRLVLELTAGVKLIANQKVPFSAVIGWIELVQDKLNFLREACYVIGYYEAVKTWKPVRILPSYVWWKGFRGHIFFR